ncbi:MAG: hypothetical protein ACK5DE_06320 [Bacteroidota bacterium]|jgi:hypothetical protein
MPCAISSGYAIDCRESVGGVQTVWVLEKSQITSYTESSGTLSAITLPSGVTFWKIEVPRATAFATNTITASQENGTFFYTHVVSFPVNSRSATVRNLINVLAKNKCVFVTLEGDGVYRMYGAKFGLFLDSAEAGSGTALADRNGYMVSFSSQETEDFIVCPSGVISSKLAS